MKKKSLISSNLILLWIVIGLVAPLAGEPQSDIQIILDTSRFAGERLGESTKLEVAVDNLLDILGTLELDCNISLRVHGGENIKEKCQNSQLLIPFAKYDPKRWEETLKSLKPAGEPSIYNALKSALGDFSKAKGNRNNIILINFSPRTCETELGELKKELNSEDPRYILHLIDYGADLETRKELSLPVGISGGTFFMPLTKKEFKKHIIEAIDLSIKSGDLLVETFDSDGKKIYFEYDITQGETNKPVGKHETNAIKSLKPGTYTVVLKTVPEKEFHNVQIEEGKLARFSVSDFGQLLIKVLSPAGLEEKVHYTIRSLENDSFLGSSDSGEPIFILEGKYKLTIHTVPYTVEKVEIKKGKKVLYAVQNLGLIEIEVKNKPDSIDKIKAVIRKQDDNLYVGSTEVPAILEIVEGTYKLIFYLDEKVTKENIKITAGKTTNVTFDFEDL